MWKQYKRSFASTQGVIVAITLGTYFYGGHMVARSATFFVVMELAGVVGAMWGTRLKNKVNRQATW
ncbi:MAG: hypothetical protein ABI560_13365 [Myxococcales bacterium]